MLDETLLNARVLIVDDQDANVLLLTRILTQMGFTNLISTTDPREVVPLFTAEPPDLLLLDLHMPHLDGFGVLEQIRPLIPVTAYLPIVVLTADVTPQAKRHALASGARDFLTKPFDNTEVVLRIKNLLQTRFLHLQLQNQNALLEDRVRARTAALEAAGLEILHRLGLAAEYRDDDTGQHIQRVGNTAARLARALSLPEDEVEVIRQAAPLHDVGKIGIPDRFLLKPASLTTEEFALMKTHTTLGADVLHRSPFAILQKAEEIALSHHERWDGTGYPRGLVGEEIPLSGRIVAVADVFDALTHARPYKGAWPAPDALAEIERLSGTHFDPRVVAAFLSLARG
ncbi:MAG: response regulator [Chloroflexota bacterium]